MRAADTRALIPVETQPMEALEDAHGHVRRGSLGVRVLNAQDESAAVAASVEPVEEGGSGSPHVEVAGRRRCEADARGHAPIIDRQGPSSRRLQRLARSGFPTSAAIRLGLPPMY